MIDQCRERGLKATPFLTVSEGFQLAPDLLVLSSSVNEKLYLKKKNSKYESIGQCVEGGLLQFTPFLILLVLLVDRSMGTNLFKIKTVPIQITLHVLQQIRYWA